MVASGNLIAEFRLSELQQLEDMTRRLPLIARQDVAASNIDPDLVDSSMAEATASGTGSVPALGGGTGEDEALGSLVPGMEDYTDIWLTTAQIIDMANSIANSDTEWVSHTMSEHDIW